MICDNMGLLRFYFEEDKCGFARISKCFITAVIIGAKKNVDWRLIPSSIYCLSGLVPANGASLSAWSIFRTLAPGLPRSVLLSAVSRISKFVRVCLSGIKYWFITPAPARLTLPLHLFYHTMAPLADFIGFAGCRHNSVWMH